MVCDLPSGMKRVIEEFKECNRTEPLEGQKRRVFYPGGVFAKYRTDCMEAVKAHMRKNNAAEYLDAGAHRFAFAYSTKKEECVVKLALSEDERALNANKDESTAWRALQAGPPGARKFFVQVDRYDPEGWWLTQPMTDTSQVAREVDEDEDGLSEKLDELHDDIRSHGLGCDDIHPGNVGYMNGELKVFDYGFGVSGCKLNKVGPPKRPVGQRSILGFGRRR